MDQLENHKSLEKWNSIFSIFLRLLAYYIAHKATISWHTLNPLNLAQCHELDTKRASPAIVARWSTDRRSGQSERYRYSRFIPHPLKIRAFFMVPSTHQGRCFVTFTKVTLSPFLAVPKKKAPLHGAEGAPSFGLCDQNSPRATECGRLTTEVVRKSLAQILIKKVAGATAIFLIKMDFAHAHKVRPSLPTQIFSNRKKNMLRSLQHAKATKRRAKILS